MAEINYGGVTLCFQGPGVLLDCMARVLGETQAEIVPAARVSCLLHDVAQSRATSFPAQERGWLSWQWRSGTAQVATRSARARIWKVGDTYEAEAWLPQSSREATTLVGALSSAVLHDAGGMLLHTASVLMESRVVAFLGPSGAGKSTACRHMSGAPIFSLDRVAVVPRRPGPLPLETPVGPPAWFAYPLFGGTALDPSAPRARPDWTPLGGLLRVHQAPRDARIEDCAVPLALASLRESAFSGGTDPGAELDLLARLECLGRDVPVGRLHFGLGSSLAPLVSRWLSRRSR